jgi:hypothetical protein
MFGARFGTWVSNMISNRSGTGQPYDGPVIAAHFKDLCMDANDPLRLGRFWAAALGGVLTQRDDGICRLHQPPGPPDQPREGS